MEGDIAKGHGLEPAAGSYFTPAIPWGPADRKPDSTERRAIVLQLYAIGERGSPSEVLEARIGRRNMLVRHDGTAIPDDDDPDAEALAVGMMPMRKFERVTRRDADGRVPNRYCFDFYQDGLLLYAFHGTEPGMRIRANVFSEHISEGFTAAYMSFTWARGVDDLAKWRDAHAVGVEECVLDPLEKDDGDV